MHQSTDGVSTSTSVAHQGLPPGPRAGEVLDRSRFDADPFGYLEALEREYGATFTLELGQLGNDRRYAENNGQWVFLSRPQDIKRMYEADASVISGALANRLFFATEEESVGYVDGAAHKLRRSQLHPSFNGSKDYSAIVQRQLEVALSAWPRGHEFRLYDELQKLTAKVILEVVCGSFSTQDRERLCPMLLKTENAASSRADIRAADLSIRALIEQRLTERGASADAAASEDVLTSLVKLVEAGDPYLSQTVVRDEVFSLLYTGFSTTSNTLSWAFLRILSEPDVRRLIHEELLQVTGGEAVQRRHLPLLSYLEATIKEVLRLHPVTALNGVRLLTRELDIAGYTLPPGTILVHCAYLAQRSPDVFSDPLSFSPERFIGKRLGPYAWGAFGGAERICIGRGFAMDEMRLILASLLSRFEMTREGRLPRAKLQGFFMAPEDGARCTIVSERKAVPAREN